MELRLGAVLRIARSGRRGTEVVTLRFSEGGDSETDEKVTTFRISEKSGRLKIKYYH